MLYVVYISEQINGCFIPCSRIGSIFSIFICQMSPDIVSITSEALIISNIKIVLPITVVPFFNIYTIAGRNDNAIIMVGVFERYCEDIKFIKLL